MSKMRLINIAQKLINHGSLGKYSWMMLGRLKQGYDNRHFSKILYKAIRYGEEGKLTVIPEILWFAATNGCNLRCVMCPGHSKKDDQYMTKEEAEKLLFLTDIEQVPHFGATKFMDLTSGEPLLNPDIVFILQMFKERYPQSIAYFGTNATHSVSGKIKEAIQSVDSLYISIDGATKETFEDIRRGANFNEVITHIKEIVQYRKERKIAANTIRLAFVAMATNIHELSAVVRIAHDSGVPSLFVQKVEKRAGLSSVYKPEKYDLDNLPKNKIREYLYEAKNEAEKLEVSLTLTSDMTAYLIDQSDVPSRNTKDSGRLPKNVKTFKASVAQCSLLWKATPFMRKTRQGVFPAIVCCHMPNSDVTTLEHFPELRGKNLTDIFNSPQYWKIRRELLDGTLADGACKGCQYIGMSQWSDEEKKQLHNTVRDVERRKRHHSMAQERTSTLSRY